MEGANEAARRAVNGLLDAVSFDGARCEVWPLHEPEVLAPWRLHDAARYERRLALGRLAAAGGGARDPGSLAAPRPGASAARRRRPVRGAPRRRAERGRRRDGRPASNDAAVATAAGGAAAGGADGFLERLGWYRDAGRRHARGGRAELASRRSTCTGWSRISSIGRARVCGRRSASRRRARLGGRAEDASRRPRASRCCTTPFSSTTTSKTAATPGEARRRCTVASGCRSPSTPATR